MNPETKKVLLITGSLLFVGAIAGGIYLYVKAKADQDQNENKVNKAQPKKNNSSSLGSSSVTSNSSSTSSSTSTAPEIVEDPSLVKPRFNSENELINTFSELKNQVLYPKRKQQEGWGYTNVRSSAEVNTNQGWWDGLTNLLTTINSGIPIGKVISETNGVFNDYSYRWFKVKLNKAVGFWGTTTEGYVRADTVTIKSYHK